MDKRDTDPCGCVPRSQSRALVILPGSLPLDTTVPDDDPTGDWPIVKPEPPQPDGWDAIN